jgi:hypothetical protein
MKRIAFTLVVLLFAISFGFALSDPPLNDENAEKTRQLEQLAEKFKTETGFRGEISLSTNRMCLGVYEGKFADVQIAADADTASFRVVFEQILDKVLPYTFTKREHLTRSRITNNLGRVRAVYFQQVNGYQVEGAGRLTIVYEIGRNGFRISNGTMDLPENVPINLSLEQAIQIAQDHKLIGDDEKPYKPRIAYVVGDDKNGNLYYLCYILVLDKYVVYVDVSNSVIRNFREHIISDSN